MRLKRFFCAALSAALLTSLCACTPKGADESGGSPATGSYSGPRFSLPGFSGTLFGNSSSEPESPPPPEYNKEHRLNAEIPALIDGLEMPVAGATGYTSVELPLWPFIPAEPEDPENPGDAENPEHSAPAQTSPDELPAVDSSASTPDKSVVLGPDEPIVLDPEHPKERTEAETSSAQLPGNTPESVPSEAPESPVDPALPEETEPEEEADPYADAVAVWEPGTAFVILEEDGDWWYVSREDVAGWIEHRYCMINLPDVVPSMIYDDTNSYASLFVSCGKEIPGVTGEAFYDSLTDNARLERQEFMMPILYSAARHICAAQHRALAEGNCLAVYQTFRPYATQRAVVTGLSQLAKDDPEVKAGVSTSPWSMTWFINTGISNHQRGFALDVSMVKVYETETKYIGSAPYLRMTSYEPYRMPTDMHELSIAAVSTISPGSGQLSETMNEPAIALRGYFTASGLSPLPSEWWHFNDNTAMRDSSGKPSNGRYFITECLSCLPDQAAELLALYAEESAKEPAEKPVEEPLEGTEEDPVEEPLEGSAEDPVEEPPEGPADGTPEGSEGEFAENPVEGAPEAPAEGPLEEPKEIE